MKPILRSIGSNNITHIAHQVIKLPPNKAKYSLEKKRELIKKMIKSVSLKN
jgi:hypothetical protein